MKKCPHCGMNIRDNVEVCGYCGGEISPQPAAASGMKGAQAPQRNVPPGRLRKSPRPPRLMSRKARRVRKRRGAFLKSSSRANRC